MPPDYNGCSYTVAPRQFAVPAQGGRVMLDVGTTSRCIFTAESSASGLRAVEGASGSGVAKVVVRVSANAVRLERAGTITIGGQTLTVTQEAAPVDVIGDPHMSLDAPIDGARVGSLFRVSGWAIDAAALDETSGVTTVHVWAYPNPGSGAAPIFLGVAGYGALRPDVAALYGGGTLNSGFVLDVSGLTPGAYRIAVFARSNVTASFNQMSTAVVTVAPDPRLVIDTPGKGALTLPTALTGWAIDAAAQGGTGIDAVHAWAFPAAGGSPIFVGAAAYGADRPDVAAAFANSAFRKSGYSLPIASLPRGSYHRMVYARRSGTTAFAVINSVDVDVDWSSRRRIEMDAPSENEWVSGTLAVSGWALDLNAASGSGIDVVHIWAFAEDGRPPVFLGAAQYGMDRDDVAAYFGDPGGTQVGLCPRRACRDAGAGPLSYRRLRPQRDDRTVRRGDGADDHDRRPVDPLTVKG